MSMNVLVILQIIDSFVDDLNVGLKFTSGLRNRVLWLDSTYYII